jgi:hypothetical protein
VLYINLTPYILNGTNVIFLSPSSQMFGIIPKIGIRPVPSTSFPIHSSLITPKFDAVWYKGKVVPVLN